MDINALAPILIALIAAIPGAWALINQGKKDRVQAQIDMSNAAQTAAIGIIQPLRDEVTRLQTRVTELETMLATKNANITQLETAVYERDKKILTLSTDLNNMKRRLDAFESNNIVQPDIKALNAKRKIIDKRISARKEQESKGDENAQKVEKE